MIFFCKKFADLFFKSKFAKKLKAMIERTLKSKLLQLMQKYPIVTLTGPRQSGKSTLLKNAFNDYNYVSLEDPDNRIFATDDPKGFLKTYPDKTIIDEAQKVPQLFSYIQTHTDSANKTGMYLLAGSQNFLLMEAIGQSLAGRTAVLKLLPLSTTEMQNAKIENKDIDTKLFKGAYPRLFDKDIPPEDFYPYYIQTYVERDVRQVKNIGDLTTFEKFIKLCAGRIGQVLNVSSLASDCGISVSTANSWLSVLETSYICYLLQPDFNNFSKRVIKSPKIYFYDTGLACSLLQISSPEQLKTHYLKGGLFENLVISEFLKHYYNQGITPDLRYFRDSSGLEIDLLNYTGSRHDVYEIKAGATFAKDYFKGIIKYCAFSGISADNCTVIYNGDKRMTTSNGKVVNFYDLFS